MANPYKGEAHLEIDNVVYTLVFKVGTLINIEEQVGKGFVRVIAELIDPERMTMTLLRIVFWHALQERHKDIKLDQAGEMIGYAGGYGKVLEKVLDAYKASFPVQEDESKTENPPSPSQIVGTGSAS